MTTAQVLIDGKWQASSGTETFQSMNPATGAPLAETFPISTWADCEKMLQAASQAAIELRKLGPEPIAKFLEDFAARLDANVDELAALANSETALPVDPRLAKVELPRTSGQLRQAAAAVRSGSWGCAHDRYQTQQSFVL